MYMLTSEYEDAIAWYTRALESIDKSDTGEYYLVKNGAKVEETEEEKDVRRSFIVTKRGECHEHRKDLIQAEADYRAAIKLNKKCHTAYLRFVIVFILWSFNLLLTSMLFLLG